jgi:hypothetical protein
MWSVGVGAGVRSPESLFIQAIAFLQAVECMLLESSLHPMQYVKNVVFFRSMWVVRLDTVRSK